jgi:hypothetical protein
MVPSYSSKEWCSDIYFTYFLVVCVSNSAYAFFGRGLLRRAVHMPTCMYSVLTWHPNFSKTIGELVYILYSVFLAQLGGWYIFTLPLYPVPWDGVIRGIASIHRTVSACLYWWLLKFQSWTHVLRDQSKVGLRTSLHLLLVITHVTTSKLRDRFRWTCLRPKYLKRGELLWF